MVSPPVDRGISKWVYRDISQSVCPFNIKFAQELKVPEFAPRPALAGKDARTLARELLAMSQEEFSATFKGSPMKRAKLRGLKRNAAVVLGGSHGDSRQAVRGCLANRTATLAALVAHGTTLCYSGDFDPDGLSMLRALRRRYGDRIVP